MGRYANGIRSAARAAVDEMTTSSQVTEPADQPLAIVLGGGGARAAYQVGVLRCLARRFPELRFDIVTGVSAGAINAIYLAASATGLEAAAAGLTGLWYDLEVEDVFRVDAPSLGRILLGWGARLISGGAKLGPSTRGMVDTTPLDRLLQRALTTDGRVVTGVGQNVERGRLRAMALTTLDYATGQTVTWVEGADIENWERPNRRSARTRITIDHVLASAALPLLFPAVNLGAAWHGDGGIRLTAPLSPALHLGARRVLAVSTRYDRSQAEAERPSTRGYPPPAQILGHLMNAVFLDLFDQDLLRLDRLNRLLERLPPGERDGLAPVEVLVLRPSRDLGRLAADYEVRLPKAFRFLTRGLGTRETESPDFLSLLMFQPDYLRRLIDLGEADAEARGDELARLVAPAKPLESP
jgi:NTE family protein